MNLVAEAGVFSVKGKDTHFILWIRCCLPVFEGSLPFWIDITHVYLMAAISAVKLNYAYP